MPDMSAASSVYFDSKGLKSNSKWSWTILYITLLTYGLWFTTTTNASSWALSNVLMAGTKGTFSITESVAIGMQKGMEECKFQFYWERWNCPSHAFTKTRSLPADREAAFVQAITAASVMYTLTRNCSRGDFDNCGCANTKLVNAGFQSGAKWKWGGCSENIQFGAGISRDYLDSREDGKDGRAVVARHNNEAGRIAVVKTMKRLCKCHGVSGSCSTQTCWMQLGDLRATGNELKDQYDEAVNVDYQNGILNVGTTTRSQGLPPLSDNNLVYFEKSPNYCWSNLTMDTQGTLGRECSRDRRPNTSKAERRSCKTLCRQCGLRVKKSRTETSISCNCKFHWCCEVKCETCKKNINKLTCVR